MGNLEHSKLIDNLKNNILEKDNIIEKNIKIEDLNKLSIKYEENILNKDSLIDNLRKEKDNLSKLENENYKKYLEQNNINLEHSKLIDNLKNNILEKDNIININKN